jgi:uncharacterized membrane protein YagU involved in acid resistance
MKNADWKTKRKDMTMSTSEKTNPPSPGTADQSTPEAENKNHRYSGHQVPWYIHIMWISFWLFAIGYVLRYLFPAIQGEFRSPP